MNALNIIRKQAQRKQALQQAQNIRAKTLCYRGNCYVKTLNI